MNSVENTIAKIIADAEAAVLKVLAEAAASGDYAAIDRARGIAEKLRAIGEGVSQKSNAAKSSPAPERKKRKRRTKAAKKDGYPQFNVKSESLYKIGWSKKKNDKYIHRVPIGVVNSIGDVLQHLSESSQPVSSDQILESRFLKEAGEPPSYQVYIVLAFLKDRGVISSFGREGFHLPADINSRLNELLLEEETA